VLVDSDILIDHLRGARALPTFALACSVITRCELFAGRDQVEALRQLLAQMQEIAVDPAIAERGGALRRSLKLSTPDALIAATALEHNLPLMTRNKRHFGLVKDLDLRVPSPTVRSPTGQPE
jgi:predicted nucleic acid-binding protein